VDDHAAMTRSRYRITVRGLLSDRFAAAFEGMSVKRNGKHSVLIGEVADQSQLYGLLNRLRDLGIELVSVEEVAP
jgi:ABC-type phosphate transport system auxiliary subunit